MINVEIAKELLSIIRHLKTSNGFDVFTAFFEEKRKEVLSELLVSSGVLTQAELIAGNAKLEIYESLSKFDFHLEKVIRSNTVATR